MAKKTTQRKQIVFRYRKISPRIWDDEKFIRLTHQRKLIVFYCLTSKQNNRIGLFKFSRPAAAEDLRMEETFAADFKVVCETMGWGFDEQTRVLYLPSWWKYNSPENENVVKSFAKDLAELPENPFQQQFQENLIHIPETLHRAFRELFQNGMPYGIGNGMPNGIGNQEQEQEHIQEHIQEQKQERGSSLNSKNKSSKKENEDALTKDELEVLMEWCIKIGKTASTISKSYRTKTLDTIRLHLPLRGKKYLLAVIAWADTQKYAYLGQALTGADKHNFQQRGD